MSETLIQQFKGDFEHISLLDRSKRGEYGSGFFNHLDGMNKYDLKFDSDKAFFEINRKERFSMANYFGLEQFVMENTSLVEGSNETSEIDWNEIDDAKDILKDKIDKLLKHEKNSETLQPIIKFTIDSFENYAIYKYMHPKSKHNPWISTHELLLDGYVYLISDKKDLISEFKPKFSEKDNNYNNIGIITKAKKERQFKGVIMDNRFVIQKLVLNYLKKFALSYSEAKTKKDIIKEIERQGINYSSSKLNSSVLLPLKRSLIIGSSSKGFYYITDKEDFKISYKFNNSKYEGIKTTMDIYEEERKRLGVAI